MLIGPCQGLLLLNLYKVCLLSFTISLKNPLKKIRNFNSFFQNTYYVCGSSTKEAYSTSGMLAVLVTYGSIFMLIKIVQFIGYTKYEDMYA